MRLSGDKNLTVTVIVPFAWSFSPTTRTMLDDDVPRKLASSCWKLFTSTDVCPDLGRSLSVNSSWGGAVGGGGGGVRAGSVDVVGAARVMVVGMGR